MRRVFAAVALVLPLMVARSLPARASAGADTQVTGPRGTVTGRAEASGTAILRGTVVAADTGAPIRRAAVRANAFEPPDNGMAVTDDQGRFEIRGLAGGRYTVNASKSGFVPITYGQRQPNARGTPVEVAPGAVVDKLVIGLPRGGVITGRIVDDAGEPLADARVQVLRSQFMPGGRRLLQMGRGDTTDDQGTFRIFGLTPGDYVVSAIARSETQFMMGPGGAPAASADASQGYAPTYYPGTPSVSDAQRVSLAAGQEVSGITFGMTPTRVSRVSGRVVGAKPTDAEDSFVMVSLDDAAGAMGGMTGGGMVQRDGTFTLTGLAPGRYTLRVQPRGRPEEAMIGVTTITVAGVDLDGVVIAMQKPGEVTGRIEFEGGPPAGISPAQVRVQPVSVDPMSRWSMSGPPRTSDDLTFSVRGLTGPTLFRAGGAPGWYVKSVEVAGEDVTETPITLAHGQDVRGIRILMTQTAAAVSGTVRDERGRAVIDATVIVFPADDTKWTVASRFIRTARPDTDGRFEMKGLPTYTGYRVIAVQGLEDMQAFDPDFLSSVRDRADGLALAAGETKTLDVKLR